MPSRSEMDKPAAVLTAVVAVALIAVSAPFTMQWWGEGTTEYEVDWESAETASAQARLTGSAQTQRAEIPAGDVLTSFVNVTVTQCTDPAAPPLQSPASISWVLTYEEGGNGTELGRGSFSCQQMPEEGFARTARPSLGAREVERSTDDEERAAARAAIWDADLLGGLNETGTYVLEVSSTRPAGAIPGLPAPALAVTFELTQYRWEPLLLEVGQDEVVR